MSTKMGRKNGLCARSRQPAITRIASSAAYVGVEADGQRDLHLERVLVLAAAGPARASGPGPGPGGARGLGGVALGLHVLVRGGRGVVGRARVAACKRGEREWEGARVRGRERWTE